MTMYVRQTMTGLLAGWRAWQQIKRHSVGTDVSAQEIAWRNFDCHQEMQIPSPTLIEGTAPQGPSGKAEMALANVPLTV